MAEKSFVFDPRMLITGPFHSCPQCGQPELGTLSIRDNVHARRCRNCSHNEEERLPTLAKKLIYLDQMVLSGIAKELDPAWRKKTRRRDDFWLEAFDRIDRLVKLQLIVCPNSPIHEIESSFAHQYESVLRRLYKHLASGVGLRFPHQVLLTQLVEAFEAWFTDREPDWNRIVRKDVIPAAIWTVGETVCSSMSTWATWPGKSKVVGSLATVHTRHFSSSGSCGHRKAKCHSKIASRGSAAESRKRRSNLS